MNPPLPTPLIPRPETLHALIGAARYTCAQVEQHLRSLAHRLACLEHDLGGYEQALRYIERADERSRMFRHGVFQPADGEPDYAGSAGVDAEYAEGMRAAVSRMRAERDRCTAEQDEYEERRRFLETDIQQLEALAAFRPTHPAPALVSTFAPFRRLAETVTGTP